MGLHEVQSLLGNELVVTLKNKRKFRGIFSALDRNFLVVLDRSVEDERVLGMISIPGHEIEKVELKRD